MSRRVKRLSLLGAASLAAMIAAGNAFAGGQTTTIAVNGGALVRGAAPLPEFHLDFLLDEPARSTSQPLISDHLEIALTSPDNSVFQLLFSPRPQFGIGFDRATGSNRSYAGLTWNLFDSSTMFSNFALAGSYDSANANDPTHRLLGPPLMLHGALELGYHFDDKNSLSLSLDQARTTDFRLGGEVSDNLHLRYGIKF